jgi:two-component system, NtrC family, sensor histidine kinase PilS
MPPTVGAHSPQNRYSLLRIYSYYRVLLAMLLIAIYFVFRRTVTAEVIQHQLYLVTAALYAALNLVTLAVVLLRPREPRPRQLFLILAIDIAALVLITHASGGIDSGFAILLMVTVAAAAIFVPGQIATLVAALASLAVLSDAMWLVLAHDQSITTLFPAGLLGMLLFAGSMLVQRLAIQMQSSEQLAQQKASQVTELQRLNQLIVQRMRTGILFIDGEDRIRMANRSASHLLGISETEIANRGVAVPKRIAEPLAGWRTDPYQVFRPLKMRPDGPHVQLAFTRLEADNSSGTLVFAEDFSEITQQAQQLKLASLGRLTASIAHEIRNPLGSISHAAQLLRESPQLPDDDQRLVDIVIGNATRTNEIIESVLTLSRGQQPNPQKLKLGEWLRQFIDELRTVDSSREPRITLEMNPPEIDVSVDPTHLRQVLTNLCENGLRYSVRRTGIASLRLTAVMDLTSELTHLDVIDQGEGIPEQQQSKIFEPFFTTEKSGTGLGLYLSRELCEANRIQLEYRSEAGSGGCFRLNFPHSERRLTILSPHN